jgi:hypothetical protein
VVIETIVNHEFEDKKGNKKTEMEAKKDSNDQLLDKSKYTDFDEKGIKKYMYEEKLGKAHEFLANDTNDDQTPTSTKDK